MRLIATCPEETKVLLAKELRELGATDIREGYMAVEFEADEETFYELHLKLRTASQIHLILRECAAKDVHMLNSQAKRIKWPEIFDVTKTFRVDAVAGDRGEEAMTGNKISKTVRLSLQTVFDRETGKIPQVELKEPDVIVVAYVHGGRATISVNTSGLTLHKRGYKDDDHPAPMKETLASALLEFAGYNGSEVLFDPMCGSGTIPIEAAMLALKKAPNIHRKKGNFAFERLKMFDNAVWRKVQDKVRSEKIETNPQPIFASDISSKFVDFARENALRARVERNINFSVKDFFRTEKPAESGLLVINLPYGDRIGSGSQEELELFYQNVGDKLKKDFTGWRAALFCSEDAPWRMIGLKPSKRVPLMNGSIKTKLFIYEMYSGSKKKKQDHFIKEEID